jgi:serine/threonine protein kinase
MDESKGLKELKLMEEIQSPEQLQAKFGNLPANFQQLQIVGRGASGLVVRAREYATDRDVAIKILFNLEAATSVERFTREARLLASLNHQHIVKIFSSGVSEKGYPFHVMEWVDGTTLAERLQALQVVSGDLFFELFRQLASALDYAHQQDVVHRDIKPSNIMLCNESEMLCCAKLLDFGVARQVSEGAGADLTKSGVLIGTPLYMSPEQCSGARQQAASDIYSLACVMYQCLSGKPPFEGDNSMEVMYKHLHESPPELKLAGFERRLPGLIASCLAKDPEKRPNAGRFLRELSEIQARLSGKMLTAGSTKASVNPLRIGLSVAAVIGFLAAAAFLVVSLHPHERKSGISGNKAKGVLNLDEKEDSRRWKDMDRTVERAEIRLHRAKTAQDKLDAWNNLAEILFARGEFLHDLAGKEPAISNAGSSEKLRAKADADFQRILTMGPQYDSDDGKSVRRSRAFTRLGALSDERGNYQASLKYHAQAISTAQKCGQPLVKIDALMARAHTYVRASANKEFDSDCSLSLQLWKECLGAPGPNYGLKQNQEMGMKTREPDSIEKANNEADSLRQLSLCSLVNEEGRLHILKALIEINRLLLARKSVHVPEAVACMEQACKRISSSTPESSSLKKQAQELATECAAFVNDRIK